jgi:hypothetical protein
MLFHDNFFRVFRGIGEQGKEPTHKRGAPFLGTGLVQKHNIARDSKKCWNFNDLMFKARVATTLHNGLKCSIRRNILIPSHLNSVLFLMSG